MNNSFDVAIVGAGTAGSITALLLAQKGLNVALLHKKHPADFICGESLPPQANPVIKRLGLEGLIDNGHHIRTNGQASAFGTDQVIANDFIFSPYGLGWHLDRKRFQHDLLDRVENSAVTVIDIEKLNNIRHNEKGWMMLMNGPSGDCPSITANFIVDASGRGAQLLKHLSINTLVHDRLACRCVIVPQLSREHCNSLIESSNEGWWYSAGLPSNKQVVMYFSDTDGYTYKNMKSFKTFCEQLQLTHHIKKTVPNATPNRQVLSFSAQSTEAQQVCGKNWLAVGDAAISYDPLSSQGLWQAMLGAEMASTHITKHFDAQTSHYAQWINTQSQHYWQLHQQFYAQEQRWKKHPFWQRRQAPRS